MMEGCREGWSWVVQGTAGEEEAGGEDKQKNLQTSQCVWLRVMISIFNSKKEEEGALS